MPSARHSGSGSTGHERHEPLWPWLGAALVAGGLLAGAGVVGGRRPSGTGLLLGTVGLAALLAAAGLVGARRSGHRAERIATEGQRPAQDQLSAPWTGASPGSRRRHTDRGGLASVYLIGMAAYTGVVAELLAHGVDVSLEAGMDHERVDELREDTDDLRRLLVDAGSESAGLTDSARLHTLCSLWEASFRAIEPVVANLDPAYYKRWRARTVVERRLRHGELRDGTDPAHATLPYQT